MVASEADRFTTEATVQRTTLTAIEGGLSLDHEQVARERQAACSVVADAAEEALTLLHPLHPHRAAFEAMRADFLTAASRPLAPRLSLAQ